MFKFTKKLSLVTIVTTIMFITSLILTVKSPDFDTKSFYSKLTIFSGYLTIFLHVIDLI